MPPIDDINWDFHIGVELSSGPFDGAYYKFILYTNHVKWSYLMAKKDLHPKFLRWYLLVQEFDFEIHDKGKLRDVGEPIDKPTVHHLSDPKPSSNRWLSSRP